MLLIETNITNTKIVSDNKIKMFKLLKIQENKNKIKSTNSINKINITRSFMDTLENIQLCKIINIITNH